MIPLKIAPYFKKLHQEMDGDHALIDGLLTCCNCTDFEVYAAGNIKHGIFSKMHLLPANENMRLEARCRKCGNTIVVFDQNCDGYNQLGCEQYIPVTAKAVICKKCLGNHFSIRIRYEYPDIQELRDLGINEVENAFTWIWVKLICSKCESNYPNFIDWETG